MALLRWTVACITIIVTAEVFRASLGKSVNPENADIFSNASAVHSNSDALDLLTSPSETVATVQTFTASSASPNAPIVTSGHSATVLAGNVEDHPSLAIGSAPVVAIPAVAGSPVVPIPAIPVPAVGPVTPAVPVGLSADFGFGALPFAGLLPAKVVGLDVQLASIYPAFEKIILVIGAGVLVLILFAFGNLFASKGVFLERLFGMDTSKGFGSWSFDSSPAQLSSSATGKPSLPLNSQSDLELTSRVNDAITAKF